MYEVRLSEQAEKDLKSFEKRMQERILSVLARIRISPYRHVRKLADLEGRFRLRVGDYRLILRIDDSKNEISILRIGHRETVYRR
jgi:mRNA interferase RelE/StbE